jgi:hypothetical protein
MSSYLEAVARNIIVDKEIKELINREKRDFRVCTSCCGPVLVPTDLVSPKTSDVVIQIGEHSLFVSLNQALYMRRMHKSLLDQYLLITENGLECNVD